MTQSYIMPSGLKQPQPLSVPRVGSLCRPDKWLQGLTLTSRPGVLTALMGGSGAGKTTLMDVSVRRLISN
jgi:ABC-type multidrug transport system ATPase subunit